MQAFGKAAEKAKTNLGKIPPHTHSHKKYPVWSLLLWKTLRHKLYQDLRPSLFLKYTLHAMSPSATLAHRVKFYILWIQISFQTCPAWQQVGQQEKTRIGISFKANNHSFPLNVRGMGSYFTVFFQSSQLLKLDAPSNSKEHFVFTVHPWAMFLSDLDQDHLWF